MNTHPFTCVANILAWEPGRQDVDLSHQLRPVDFPDVAQVRGVGKAVGQDHGGGRVNLRDEFDALPRNRLHGDTQSAVTGAQLKNRHD